MISFSLTCFFEIVASQIDVSFLRHITGLDSWIPIEVLSRTYSHHVTVTRLHLSINRSSLMDVMTPRLCWLCRIWVHGARDD